MESVDLERLKRTWQYSIGHDDESLTGEKFTSWLKASSNDLYSFFRKGLLIDIILKSALLIAVGVLTFIIPGWGILNGIDILSILLIIISAAWQVHVLSKLPTSIGHLNLSETLQRYLDFYYQYYQRSVFVAALSAPLFFIIGSNHYMLIKYQEIPVLQADDLVVLSSGILVSYGLSLLSQHNFTAFRIRQVEQTLDDIREERMHELRISKYKTRMKKLTMLLGISLIIGIIIIIWLILKT